nr:hypothetical protein Itr_chr07CG02970 [Ipomoea trifida]
MTDNDEATPCSDYDDEQMRRLRRPVAVVTVRTRWLDDDGAKALQLWRGWRSMLWTSFFFWGFYQIRVGRVGRRLGRVERRGRLVSRPPKRRLGYTRKNKIVKVEPQIGYRVYNLLMKIACTQ